MRKNNKRESSLANAIFIFALVSIIFAMYSLREVVSSDLSIMDSGSGSSGFSISDYIEEIDNSVITFDSGVNADRLAPPAQQEKNSSQSREDSNTSKEVSSAVSSSSLSSSALDIMQGNSGDTIPVRKWAYTFLAGGCSRKRNRLHSGFIANIAVAAQTLLDHNSTADVVAILQMTYDSEHDTILEDETKLLEALPNVKIKYLPKLGSKMYENFYALMMEKFLILGLTEYSRVLFLDSDVMPLVSLDYLFELSEPLPENKPAMLEENVILRWSNDPAAGGFFMLKPSKEGYLRAQKIITETEKKALELPWPHFDPVVGFGHIIEESDGWTTIKKPLAKNTNWTWHGSFADQGFLYHWVRYEAKKVSIINSNSIDNYSLVNGKLNMKTISNDGHGGAINKLSPQYGFKPYSNHVKSKSAPFIDFVHFIGEGKPWKSRKGKVLGTEKDVKQWFNALDKVEKRANVKMEFPKNDGGAPYGAYPVYKQRIDYIKLKAKHNWDHFTKVDDNEIKD